MNTERVVSICAFLVFAAALLVVLLVLPDSLDLQLYQWLLVFGGTFGISRIISREKIAEPIRSVGLRLKMSSLVSCPRCIGVWIALALAVGMALLPQVFVFICALFSVAGANILLHELMGIMSRFSENLDMDNENMEMVLEERSSKNNAKGS